MTHFYDINIQGLNGSPFKLADLKGKLTLVVNVASECGLTPQYKGLQALYERYKDQGFCVVGVPCNQFGGQEPGSEDAIAQFCTTKYAVTFPMSEKVEVNGNGRHPLYEFLVEDGDDIEWNFAKFLVSKEGHVLQRFNAKLDPECREITQEIEAHL